MTEFTSKNEKQPDPRIDKLAAFLPKVPQKPADNFRNQTVINKCYHTFRSWVQEYLEDRHPGAQQLFYVEAVGFKNVLRWLQKGQRARFLAAAGKALAPLQASALYPPVYNRAQVAYAYFANGSTNPDTPYIGQLLGTVQQQFPVPNPYGLFSHYTGCEYNYLDFRLKHSLPAPHLLWSHTYANNFINITNALIKALSLYATPEELSQNPPPPLLTIGDFVADHILEHPHAISPPPNEYPASQHPTHPLHKRARRSNPYHRDTIAWCRPARFSPTQFFTVQALHLYSTRELIFAANLLASIPLAHIADRCGVSPGALTSALSSTTQYNAKSRTRIALLAFVEGFRDTAGSTKACAISTSLEDQEGEERTPLASPDQSLVAVLSRLLEKNYLLLERIYDLLEERLPPLQEGAREPHSPPDPLPRPLGHSPLPDSD